MIGATARGTIRTDLQILGVHHSSLFPGLDGLVEYLNRTLQSPHPTCEPEVGPAVSWDNGGR